MSILLNTLLLYPDHPYGFDAIWARAFDPQTREYVRFLAATPANLSEDQLFAKERALIADVSEELRQGRRCQIYATYTGDKDVTLRLETILRQAGFRVVVLRSSVPTEKREDWYERQLQAGVEVVVCHPKLVETGLGSVGLSDALLLRDWLLAAHAASGEPAFVADWPASTSAREVRHLRRDNAGDLPSADG